MTAFLHGRWARHTPEQAKKLVLPILALAKIAPADTLVSCVLCANAIDSVECSSLFEGVAFVLGCGHCLYASCVGLAIGCCSECPNATVPDPLKDRLALQRFVGVLVSSESIKPPMLRRSESCLL